jgi:alpha/beta superfamily hydrolase
MGAAPDPHDPQLGAPGRHTTANTVVVHGDRDETVPLTDSIAWATPREVPGGEHFFHRKLHILREIVLRWVR